MYENDGLGNFTTRTIDNTSSSGDWIHAADLDGDGDTDILTASFGDDSITWGENDGGINPSFTSHTISSTASGVRTAFPADLDNDGDGDSDILAGAQLGDRIVWFENYTVD